MKSVSPLGRLRKRVTLEQPVETLDAIGGVTRGLTDRDLTPE